MSSERESVRAEIKSWERQFKAENGREPSVQDIKDNPSIATKYKLYKQLSKSSAATARSAATNLPRTRHVEPTQPLSSFNPFSPQKKGKQKESTAPNPLTTPEKGKRAPSPDPFASHGDVRSQLVFQAPPTAVSRARKRLRGEPVSPSPQKRPRLVSASLLFGRDSDDEDDGTGAASFVDDSPVKQSLGSKSFKLLFEDEAAKLPHQSPNVKMKAKSSTNPRNRLVPTKSNLHSTKEIPDQPTKAEVARTVLKRPPPVEEESTGQAGSTSLIPPSPPSRVDSLSNGVPRGKERRKKTRTEEDEDDEPETLQPIKLVERVPSYSKRNFDSDPEFILECPISPSLHIESEANFDVELPDKLREVLALSPADSRARDLEEERLVSGLVYGRREGHYDPVKGGEIWDVGEESSNEEAGDEWEGEPVPWEVGELE